MPLWASMEIERLHLKREELVREMEYDPVGYYFEMMNPGAEPEKATHYQKVESVQFNDNRKLRKIDRKQFETEGEDEGKAAWKKTSKKGKGG